MPVPCLGLKKVDTFRKRKTCQKWIKATLLERATGSFVQNGGKEPCPMNALKLWDNCYAASLLFGARFFSDWNVELLFGQLNHVRVSGTAHLLEIKGLFEPLDLLESLGQGELFGVNLGLL